MYHIYEELKYYLGEFIHNVKVKASKTFFLLLRPTQTWLLPSLIYYYTCILLRLRLDKENITEGENSWEMH